MSSQKESSREKIKIKNLIKLSNLKEKLAFKGNFKIKLRNGSLNSQQSQNGEASQKEEAKTTRSVIKKYVHKIDNEPEGGTRKKIKQKVSLLLNQNLKNTLKSTKRLATKLDQSTKAVRTDEPNKKDSLLSTQKTVAEPLSPKSLVEMTPKFKEAESKNSTHEKPEVKECK